MDGAKACSSSVRIPRLAFVEAKRLFRSHGFRLFLVVAVVVELTVPALVLFAFDRRRAMVAQLGLSTATLFATLLGLFAGATSLPEDRACGVSDLLLSRPLSLGGYVFGKWLGIGMIVFLSTLLLGGCHLVSLALRGGVPGGVADLLGGLAMAVAAGGLAGAVAIALSTFLSSGGAFAGALIFLVAGHAASLASSTPFGTALSLLLPRGADLDLSMPAAFGTLTFPVLSLALLHAFLYAAFSLFVATRVLFGKT